MKCMFRLCVLVLLSFSASLTEAAVAAPLPGAGTDIGADEAPDAWLTGPLSVAVFAESVSVKIGREQAFHAEISGLPSGVIWDFGDLAAATNQNPVSHAFESAGVYTVRVTATNDTDIAFAEIQIVASAGNVFVALDGTHEPPFATWETAATNIQDAVDSAPWGGTVHVADGTYDLGGRPASGLMLTNRVCIEKPVTVRGENGPAGVILRGARHAPETACGPGAVRGVYLGHRDARLVGVTVEAGATSDSAEIDGGGVYCAFSETGASNCVVTACAALGYGGGCYGGILYDCLLTSNAARNGGGYYVPPVDAYGELYRCRVWDNRASGEGGGVFGATLYSCVLAGNTAGQSGGGTYGSTLESCSVLGNTALLDGGGCYGCTAYNSIIYHNAAAWEPDTEETVCENCCTPNIGAVTVPPQVAGFHVPHLLSGSPCIDAGVDREWMTAAEGFDMDREARITGVNSDIGASEAVTSDPTGPLAIEVFAETLAVTVGTAQDFRAEISGLPAGLFWDFGDGTVVTNQNPVNRAFVGTGAYTVRAAATNGSSSVFAEIQIVVSAGDVFVALNGTHEPPFATWKTAATNIQDAVDVAPWGGTVQLAAGTYDLGGRPATGFALTNRVCIEKPITLRGANTPAGAVVRGAWHAPETACGPGAVRGVYLGHRAARLVGVTVEAGATSDYGETDGGGVYCMFSETGVSNCAVKACTAAGYGGGVSGGTWLDCQLNGNVANYGGGGAYGAGLMQCALIGNTANWYGGGAIYCTLSGSLVDSNEAVNGEGGGAYYSSAVRCKIRYNAAGGTGGGANGGSLVCCLVVSNMAYQAGGAASAELNNCTVCANVASYDVGGVGWCSAINSIVWGNVAPFTTNALFSTFDHCVTRPRPEGEDDLGNNVDADPQFVNPALGNYRLRGNSPCIDIGTNMPWVVGELDLDGRARFITEIVDLGAYEYVPSAGYAALGTPIDWLDGYGLGPDWDAAELDDPDKDGFPTWQEYIALTSPTDGASCFAIRVVAYASGGADVSFDTAVGRVYTVLHSAGLAPTSWADATAPLAGDGGRKTVRVPDTGDAFFYRVRVALP